MLSGQRVIAVVPARGGDDEVPYLNIKKLGPMPLIAYTLLECQKSRYIDRIIVSTDDDEVARIAESHGAQAPFRRPDNLARDIPLIKPIIDHAVRTIEAEEGVGYGLVVTLQATSPFRTHDQIDAALEKLTEGELDSVISVRKVRALRWRQAGQYLEPLFDKAGRRENLEPVFDEDGAIWAMRRVRSRARRRPLLSHRSESKRTGKRARALAGGRGRQAARHVAPPRRCSTRVARLDFDSAGLAGNLRYPALRIGDENGLRAH